MKYDKEIVEKCLNLYKSGLTALEVSKIAGVSKSSIQYWSQKEGFEKKGKVGVTKQKVLELYRTGVGVVEISKQLDICRTSVTNHLTASGIVLRKGVISMVKNENYFDNIDTEDKAYWLGWLMADGNVSIYNNQYSIKVAVAMCDKNIIDGFLKYIDSSNATKIKENNTYYTSATNKHMVESLMKHGVVPNKSTKEIMPIISNDLKRHFVRGYFDGDGITCLGKQKRSGFCGSREFLEEIQYLLNVEKKIRFNNGTYYFTSGVAFSKILYEYIYSEANLWLDRKRNRLHEICGNTEVISKTNRLLTP